MNEDRFTRFEVGFVAGYVYGRALKRYAGVNNWSPEMKQSFLDTLDEALHMLGHQTEFEIDAANEIEQLLGGNFGDQGSDS